MSNKEKAVFSNMLYELRYFLGKNWPIVSVIALGVILFFTQSTWMPMVEMMSKPTAAHAQASVDTGAQSLMAEMAANPDDPNFGGGAVSSPDDSSVPAKGGRVNASDLTPCRNQPVMGSELGPAYLGANVQLPATINRISSDTIFFKCSGDIASKVEYDGLYYVQIMDEPVKWAGSSSYGSAAVARPCEVKKVRGGVECTLVGMERGKSYLIPDAASNTSSRAYLVRK
ncbi:MAG: hypothetical protein R3B38_01335 [Patescibacteria group bacterium]